MERNPEPKDTTQEPEQALDKTPHSRPSSPRAHGTDLTGVFRQLTLAEPSRSVPNSASSHESEPHSATDMFGTVATPQSQDEPGFTQMFESLGAHAEVPKAAAISTDSGKDQRSVPAAQGSGGEFTQLLRKLDEPQKQGVFSAGLRDVTASGW